MEQNRSLASLTPRSGLSGLSHRPLCLWALLAVSVFTRCGVHSRCGNLQITHTRDLASEVLEFSVQKKKLNLFPELVWVCPLESRPCHQDSGSYFQLLCWWKEFEYVVTWDSGSSQGWKEKQGSHGPGMLVLLHLSLRLKPEISKLKLNFQVAMKAYVSR